MSNSTNDQAATSQSFAPYIWISTSGGPPTAAVIGNPIANPVTDGSHGSGVAINCPSSLTQELTTMSSVVTQETFNSGATIVHTHRNNSNATISTEPHSARVVVETETPRILEVTEPSQDVSTNLLRVENTSEINDSSCNLLGQGPSQDSAVIEVTADSIVCTNGDLTKFYLQPVEIPQPTELQKKKKKRPVRRRLSSEHREMIIDLIFNEAKTSREVSKFENFFSYARNFILSNNFMLFVYHSLFAVCFIVG